MGLEAVLICLNLSLHILLKGDSQEYSLEILFGHPEDYMVSASPRQSQQLLKHTSARENLVVTHRSAAAGENPQPFLGGILKGMGINSVERIDRYKIVRLIGQGAMGTIYEAQDETANRRLAIKLFNPSVGGDEIQTAQLISRFDKEVKLLTEIDHQNVVKVYDSGEFNSRPYYVMEFIEGYSLQQAIRKGRHFDPLDLVDIMIQLASGVNHCHERGIIHRDIKPGNIMVTTDGVVKLTDFGVARAIWEETISKEGTILGTPNYISPEQIQGKSIDGRSDIFSIGVVLYEMLTGKKPFEGDSLHNIFYNIVNADPPEPTQLDPAIPQDLSRIVQKALAKDPEDRYQNIGELAKALVAFEGLYRFNIALPSTQQERMRATAESRKRYSKDVGLVSDKVAVSNEEGVTRISDRDAMGASASVDSEWIYCVDCGKANSRYADVCIACNRMLLKRSQFSVYTPERQDQEYLRSMIGVLIVNILIIAALAFGVFYFLNM